MSSHSYIPTPGPAGGDACEVHEVDAHAVSHVRAHINRDRIERASRLLGLLADPTRLLILHALSVEPLCVCDIVEIVGISQSGVSHQLRALRDAGIVDCDRIGRRAVYRIADPSVPELLADV